MSDKEIKIKIREGQRKPDISIFRGNSAEQLAMDFLKRKYGKK
jgi:hypothetical protein